MVKHQLLMLLLSIIPFSDGDIPDALYWECHAEGIDPDLIYQCVCEGDEKTLKDLIESYMTPSEDLYDVLEAEDLFRLEVLQDLENNGIEYEDGIFYVRADIHNS